MKIARTLLGLALLLLVGCWKSPDTAPHDGGGASVSAAMTTAPQAGRKLPAEWTANEILQQLLASYRQAKTYRDNAVVRLSYRRDRQPMNEQAPAALAP